MKNHLLFLLIIIPLCQINAQDYDLVVKSNGDSIACRIDSITDSHIYFKMKNRGHWIHTNILLNDVIEYKRNVIFKKAVAFKPGTSYITPKQDAANSIRDIPKNSVYAGILSLSYSRLIPGDDIGFTLSFGLSFVPTLFDDGIGIMGETTVLIGGTKHFFEPGIMAYFDADNIAPLIRTSYRYQGPEGFLFRAGILFNFMDGFGAGPALSLGYSF
jgi:hypothetical protein